MSESPSKIVSFIDVGTNSIHILVVKFFKGVMGTPIFQDKETVRLGQNLYKHGFIDPATIEKSKVVMTNFIQMSKDLGAEEIIAYATCAAREAANSKELIDALNVDGTDVRVISGLEEARLIKLGVFGPDGPDRRTLEIDIGGGSTEIVLCEKDKELYTDSLSMGSVRFAYGCDIDQTKALTFQEYDYIRKHVDMMSYRASRKIRSIGFERAYGSSGTIIALAEMCAAKRDGDSSYMMYYELAELMKELYSKDAEERKNVPGLNPSRADIIVSGGAIAEELMYLFGIDRIEVSTNGMKQGMEIDYLLGRGHSNFNVKESSVMSLANRCQYDQVHAETVRRNALLLFDDMKELGLHDVGDEMRMLLSYAATLHDIGEFINYTKHHIHSYTIILNSFMQGFDNRELRIMALLTRFHHKSFPNSSSKLFSNLNSKDISDILRCAMILKVADILDRHHNSSMDMIAVSLSEDKLVIGLGSDADISMEIWKLKSIKDDFKEVFNIELEIERI